MGLIADIVESAKAAFISVVGNWIPAELLSAEQIDTFLDSMEESVRTANKWDWAAAGLVAAPGVPPSLVAMRGSVRSAGSFIAELLGSWSEELNKVLGVLNVDAPANLDQLDLGNPGTIDALLGTQVNEAQGRVTAVVTTVNFILLSSTGISIASEFMSAGKVRSVAEAVQSWIWANGLGQLMSMAYQPQLDASVNPMLGRNYNYKSQSRIPDAGDLIRFQLREVYDPVRREELLTGLPRGTFNSYMRQNGYSEYHSDSFWAAHWVLPSVTQLNEMLFRGVIDSATWRRFVQYNDYDPSSIPRLEEIIYRPFTRVDARRMASLGVLSRTELLQAYADVGYYAETRQVGNRYVAVWKESGYDPTIDKAQALAIWTAMFNAMPILRSRYRNGWIDQDELRLELVATGLPDAAVEERYQMIVKAAKEERAAPEKDLTRALVVRGWKLRLISFSQAQFLLQRMGYDLNEAELILKVQSMPDDPLAFVNTGLGARLLGGRGLASEVDVEPPEFDFVDMEG